MTSPRIAIPRTEQEAELQQTVLDAYMVTELLRMRGPELEALLAAQRRAEATGPLLDPTLWLKNGERMQEDMRVVAILVDAVRALEELPWPARSQADGDGDAPAYGRCCK